VVGSGRGHSIKNKDTIMADFLYLFRGGDDMGGTPEQQQQHMQKWVGWIKDLGDRGHFKAGEPLFTEGKVIRGTKREVTDGPYAESKDLVGGYLIVTANDLAHATELAQGCPILEVDGNVEVRQIRPM
jgi:hypothetical protein